MDAPSRRYVRMIRAGLQSGNKLFRDALEGIEFLVAGKADPWLDPFVEDFERFEEGSEAIPFSRRFATLCVTRMIHTLTMSLDLRQREPRGFELLLRVKLSLVKMVRRLRVGALTKHQQ